MTAARGGGRNTSGRVTMEDVARRAGVTSAVVSRLINNKPGASVRPETRARVLAAISELGYRPNAAARSLSRAKTDTFGLIIPDFDNPVYAKIIEGAESAAVSMGCVLLTGSAAGSGLSAAEYVERLDSGRIDGLLLAGADPAGTADSQVPEAGVPYLRINRSVAGDDRYIVLDDEGAAALAVSHLVNIGHRRVAHLGGPVPASTAQRRLAGFRRSMAEAGLAVPEEFVVSAEYSPSAGRAGMEQLMALRRPPTAVFVASVAAAIGALHAASTHGVRIPEQMSLVAVHDLPLAEFLVPPLTTVRMPLAEFGARALHLLAQSEPDAPVTEIFDGPMQLVIRGSTAPAPTRARTTPYIDRKSS